MTEQPRPSGAVFLSYASEDADAAARICEALRAAGVEVWFDKSELRGGDAWDSQIKKQIHDCALFIPLISAHTNARSEGYFRGEWHLATRRLHNMADDAAFLVPVVVDDTREAEARVPEEFFQAHWTWLPGGETPPEFAQRIRQLLGLGHAPAPKVKAAALGVIEPREGRHGPARPRGTPLMGRFVLPLIALLLALGGAALWYFQDAGDAPATEPVVAAAPSATAVAPNDKSIAVLPFVNMSPDKDQEYFADGIAEELLNLLAQVPDLKVIARTSSFSFKGEKIEIAEIARKLNVAHVLEGSVRKSGNQLRITAQLVRASDSTHLWSQTYDRPMTDVFKVQDEIANAIVQALQIQLAGGELSRRKGGTQNLEAYQLFLKARSASDMNNKASLDAAADYSENAIKLDADYGMAWELLTFTYVLKADNGYLPAEEGFTRARQLAQHALQVSPDLAVARGHLAYMHIKLDRDWAAAETELKRGLAIDPTNPTVLTYAGMLSYTLGRWDEAARHLRAGLVQDPVNPYLIWNLGFTYYGAERFAESESTYRKLLEIAPDFLWTRGYLGKTLLMQGKPEAALAMVQQEADEVERLAYLPVMLQAAGRQAEADEALQALVAQRADTSAYFVAATYAYRGEYELALQWLERAYVQKDSTLNEILGEHLFRGMADVPRYKAFLRKMNLPVDAK
jgi:TolB-like protein/Flp pilus assembly protein TadD